MTGSLPGRGHDGAVAVVGGGVVLPVQLVLGLAIADPIGGVARPRVDPDHTATFGLTGEER